MKAKGEVTKPQRQYSVLDSGTIQDEQNSPALALTVPHLVADTGQFIEHLDVNTCTGCS